MLFREDHEVKYKNPQDRRIDFECESAFQYLQDNIERFSIYCRKYRDWMNQNGITNNDIKSFISSLDYEYCNILCKDVLWDSPLVDNKFDEGNELYVFIIDNCRIKRYRGKIYLKFSKNNRIISFHPPLYDTIIRDTRNAIEPETVEKKEESFKRQVIYKQVMLECNNVFNS
jgi:hypothetical protein